MPQIVWTDHRRRLVMQAGATPAENTYKLEARASDLDAMGKPHWQPVELTWELFTTILKAVVAWAPVTLNVDEL